MPASPEPGSSQGGRPRSDREVFDAIADPSRRAILDGLAGGPRAAGEIAADFSISRPAISRHLRALEGAGLVRVSKEGRKRMYEIDPEPLQEVDRWMQRYRTMWAARLVAIKQHVESRSGEAGADSRQVGGTRKGASP